MTKLGSRALIAGAACIALFCTIASAADFVWWEGETPAATNFPQKTYWSASTFQATRQEILSGGDWLTNDGKRTGPEAFAKYDVAVPADGAWHLWARKFWKHGPFKWRLDQQDWQTCGQDVGLLDSQEIRQFLCVNWVYLGKVQLAAGPHAFELRLLAKEGEGQAACFDCFVLMQGAFSPHGRLKPGERSGKAEQGWWAFEPPADQFGKAMLDLRGLNETAAGVSGCVRRQGDQFVLGDGKPVRFWAVNCGPDVVRMGQVSADYLARRLAKLGVNMVRIHGPVFDHASPEPGSPGPAAVDADYLGKLHYFIAALKRQGVYTELSFYFPLWFDVKPGYGIPGYDTIENKKPFALLYFDGRMQEIYKSWARGLLTVPNPHTGLPLGKDPAVAIIEIVNEDSYLFWTFAAKNVPRVQMQKLEKLFGQWLTARYGSIPGAYGAWGRTASGPSLDNWRKAAGQFKDDPAAGVMAILDIWHLTEKGRGDGPKRRRMSDQLQFLAENQKAFYDRTVKFLRDDIGTTSLIACSNWTTADPRLLDSIERWTYTAGDVIDQHGYFSGEHKGPRAGYSVSAGDTYVDRAGVLEPQALPIRFNQVAGFPHVITEIGWTSPNRYKAECPLLCAAYGGLQGIDGIFFFAIGGMDWQASPAKFGLATPSIMGQFPAAALIYRRGDVQEAKPVFNEVSSLADLYDFKGSAAITPQNLDDLRKPEAPAATAAGQPAAGIDPLAFYAGRVVRSFGKARSVTGDPKLSACLGRQKKTVMSSTGELAWDYGAGAVTVNTPKTRAAVGFLKKAGPINLGDTVIDCRNEFACIIVTALDGRPIASSGRILIQAMTEDTFFGWKADGGKIASLGGWPINVRAIDATVTLKGQRPCTVRVLDELGYPRGIGKAKEDAGRTVIELDPRAICTVVEFK